MQMSFSSMHKNFPNQGHANTYLTRANKHYMANLAVSTHNYAPKVAQVTKTRGIPILVMGYVVILGCESSSFVTDSHYSVLIDLISGTVRYRDKGWFHVHICITII